MYKDPDKQREANRKAQAKFKAKGVTKQGITLPKKTDLGNTLTTTQTVGAVIPKRGKDIKCFEDLPADVQMTINYMSWDKEGEVFNQEEKDRRTVAAIHYQHLFPDRYYSTGAT